MLWIVYDIPYLDLSRAYMRVPKQKGVHFLVVATQTRSLHLLEGLFQSEWFYVSQALFESLALRWESIHPLVVSTNI